MLNPGDILAGDYVIDALVGKGGMGCVYRAHDAGAPAALGGAVAIKELPRSVRLASGRTVAQGVSSQMKLMKRIDHSGVAKLLDAFQWEDCFYLVFEYVDGPSLRSVVAGRGPLDEQQVLAWALELCGILGYLHGLEPPVVYRDMKPSNVLIDASGALKLVDLGIAREFKDAQQEKDTIAFGTQGYAPPEQYGHAQTDARSDIYALGCTLWHLLAGVVPPMEFPLPDVRTVNAQVSEGFAGFIARCTQLDRQQRYQSCAQAAADLRRLQAGGGPAVRLVAAFRKLLKPRNAAASAPGQAPVPEPAEVFLRDVPTTVLSAAERATGELPLASDDFFFVVVQSELVCASE